MSHAAQDSRAAAAVLHRRLFGPRPVGLDLIASLAAVAVAIGLVLALGVVKTGGGAFAVVLSPLVLLLALVPAPVLQFVLIVKRRDDWPAQDAYVWAEFGGEGLSPSAEVKLRPAMEAALLAAGSGGDCLAPLAAARQEAGKMPAGHGRRIVAARYRGVIVAILGGVWILVAIVIGMAVAGGVVWL